MSNVFGKIESIKSACSVKTSGLAILKFISGYYIYTMQMKPKHEVNGEIEAKIIDAATKVFIRNGFAGTSMQHIADEAGISRPSLNYYFRTKEKLFELVFNRVTETVVPTFMKSIVSDNPVKEKFTQLIDDFFDMLVNNPFIPIFILHEITANPSLLVNSFRKEGFLPEAFFSEIESAMENGILKKTDPRNLMINLLGLIVFPFVAQPIIQGLLFDNNKDSFVVFVNQRKKYLKDYFIESISV